MRTTERPSASKRTRTARGGFRSDGSWDSNANPEGQPLDWLTQRIDALCASRRRHDRRYTPADFARRIESRYPNLVGTVFAPETITSWSKSDNFEAWPNVDTDTIAERAIRDGGLGMFVHFIDGRPVDRRTMIHHAQGEGDPWASDPAGAWIPKPPAGDK